jgi:hypothetical protein
MCINLLYFCIDYNLIFSVLVTKASGNIKIDLGVVDASPYFTHTSSYIFK